MRGLLILVSLLFSNTSHSTSIEDWCPRNEFRIETTLGTKKLYDRSCALVISASDYEAYKLGWVNIPEDYADRFSDALTKSGFSVKRVKRATSTLLKKELTEFLSNRTPPNTRLLVYFSGHGDRDQKLIGYIVPEDAPTIHENLSEFTTKSISSRQIQHLSRTSSAKHLLFIFDSCHSGALYQTRSPALTSLNLKRQVPSELLFEDISKKSRQFITATDDVSKAPVISEFTEQLIVGFEGGAIDPNLKFVSGKSLYLWLRSKVQSRVPQFGDIDSEGGDVVISQPTISFVRTEHHKVDWPKPDLAAVDQEPASENTNPIFDKSKIIYYQKLNDGREIFDALDEASIPYTSTRANKNPDKYQTNTIACHPSGRIEPVKAVARALINSGVKVMEIQSFKNLAAKAKERIELLNTASYEQMTTTKPLSIDQVESLSKCPNVLRNPRFN